MTMGLYKEELVYIISDGRVPQYVMWMAEGSSESKLVGLSYMQDLRYFSSLGHGLLCNLKFEMC